MGVKFSRKYLITKIVCAILLNVALGAMIIFSFTHHILFDRYENMCKTEQSSDDSPIH